MSALYLALAGLIGGAVVGLVAFVRELLQRAHARGLAVGFENGAREQRARVELELEQVERSRQAAARAQEGRDRLLAAQLHDINEDTLRDIQGAGPATPADAEEEAKTVISEALFEARTDEERDR